MGAMTRKGFAGDEKGKGGFTPDDINTGFFGAALQAGKEGFGAKKDAVGDKIGSIPVVGGFLNQRRMLRKAKKKQDKASKRKCLSSIRKSRKK